MRLSLLLASLILGVLAAPTARADSTSASSEARTDAGVQGADLAFDGLLSTAWAEGDEGAGEGSWVEVHLDRPMDIVSVTVWPGNLKDGWQSLKQWGRPKTITVTLSGGGPDITLQAHVSDVATEGPQRVDVPIRGRARTVRVTIDDAYSTGAHPDTTCIAEVGLNFAEGEPHPWVGKVFAWITGDEGVQPKKKNLVKIRELTEKAKGDGDEAQAALADLMDQAGDGAPYIRRWVARFVPLGFRIHAIPPNQAAIGALLALKNPVAIPAIEKAALRVEGYDHEHLDEAVQKFYAYQELIGGPPTDVPPWGRSGWAKGELRGFGEPLPVEIDQRGEVYVADVANNRVQRFTSTGGVDQVLGAQQPNITDVWIEGKRPWYVSGSEPGREAGQFVIPLDLAMIPGKTEDLVAVLDSAGRVQVFGPDGSVRDSFKAPVVNLKILPGVGGQAYLLQSRGDLVVLWGDAAFVYSMDGQQLGRWDITDGVPSGAVTLKNGKLGLLFGNQLVMYSADGFRHGNLLGDTAGEGFEGWDAALDEKGKLWVVTDKGWAIKYKRPGKVDYKLRLSDQGFAVPRLAVQGDVLYVTSHDRVQVFDALKLKAKAATGSN